MQYALLFYLDHDTFDARRDPQRRDEFWRRFAPYMQALQSAGVVAGGAGLESPDQAVTLARDGVQDGPYAETKEQLGGFFLIDVPDRDTALGWGRRYVDATGGRVEVRPCLPPRQ
jgi:hypothetical protein